MWRKFKLWLCSDLVREAREELQYELQVSRKEKDQLYWSNMDLRRDLVTCDRQITQLENMLEKEGR